MLTKKKYLIISIVGLSTAFALQVLWLVNSLQFTTDKIRTDISAKLETALFEEAEKRACSSLQSIPISPVNSNQPDITYFETELSRRTHSNISLSDLKKILSKDSLTDFTIIVTKEQQQYYVEKLNTLFAIKSKVIYTKADKSESIQLELTNPYTVFFEELGLLIFATFLMLLAIFYCIYKQVNIIRVQKEIAKVKQDFTYSMIHDIKTPLSTMRMGLITLENEKIANDPVKRSIYLQMISGENQHAYSLINKILTINKMESRKLELKKEQVNLVSQLHDIEKNFKMNRHKNIFFENDIKCPFVYADEEYLKEVFYNLIDNSIKYSDGDVTIRISSQKVDRGVSIRVRDNGIGISKADQKVIFDKYERASASKRTFKKSGAPGFGLGLAFVFLVIDAHHGIIAVDSKLNEYSEFSIFLPDQDEISGGAMS